VLRLHRVEDVTLLLVASEAGKLYVFDLQSLDAGHSCALLNEFELCSLANMLVCFGTVLIEDFLVD